MNPYYLSTEALSYGFGNGYSSGSGTSSPAGINPALAQPLKSAPPSGPSGSAPQSGPASSAGAPAASAGAGGAGQGSSTASASASASASAANAASNSAPLSGPLVAPHQDLNDFLESFWTRQMDGVERETPDFKTYNLPLARIKKVMKSDEEVKMISAEAPIMFSKACEIFISELTCRAWLVAEGHKRRTLQKSDVASAIAFSDVFDFLIDIVPRDDGTEHTVPAASAGNSVHADNAVDAAVEGEWTHTDQEERDSDALYSEYVQGEGEGFA